MGLGRDVLDLPVDELVNRALVIGDPDDWDYADITGELQRRGNDQVFDAMVALCDSQNSGRQVFGLHVLSQLGHEWDRSTDDPVLHAPFTERSLPTILRLCDAEMPDAVVVAALNALAHSHNERCLPMLVTFARHQSPDVRLEVAMSLPSVTDEPPDSATVQVLIDLSSDEDSDVRDWATFAIGSILHVDSPEVSKALWDRVDDSDSDTVHEALLGLGERGDPKVIARIESLLRDENVGVHIVEAAVKIGDARFLEPLIALVNEGWDDKGESPGWLGEVVTDWDCDDD